MLLARADELEVLLRLSLGDLRTPAELASGLSDVRRGLLLARIALAASDHRAAELRILRLLPTSTYLQIADTCTSRATRSKSTCGRSTKNSA